MVKLASQMTLDHLFSVRIGVSQPKNFMKHEPWYKWRWDTISAVNCQIPYKAITRWRCGWVTFYKFENNSVVEWKIYLPFNISFGVQLNTNKPNVK